MGRLSSCRGVGALLALLAPLADGFMGPSQCCWGHINRGASSRRGSGGQLMMRVEWDPFTGRFVDVDDSVPRAVPPRPEPSRPASLMEPGQSASKAVAKTKPMPYNLPPEKEDDEETARDLELQTFLVKMEAEVQALMDVKEDKTWPELTGQMRKVLKTDMDATRPLYEAMDESLFTSPALVCGPDSPVREDLVRVLTKQRADTRSTGVNNVDLSAAKGVGLMVLFAAGPDKPGLLPFMGGGSPAGLDDHKVEELIHAAGESLRQVVVVSSLGTERTGVVPFNLENMGGSLDKKRGIEQSVRRLSKTYGFTYSIVRTGSWSSKRDEAAIQVEAGDALQGSTSPEATSKAVLYTLVRPEARNTSMSIISTKGPAPSDAEWKDNFLKLVGPELLRIPLKTLTANEARRVVRIWARQFMEGQRKLTTPVFAVRTPVGAKIYFIPKDNKNLGPSFREEKAYEKAVLKGKEGITAPKQESKSGLEGGLEVCVDEDPFPRVRIRRIAVDDRTIIKAMSERDLIDSLKEELSEAEAAAAASSQSK